MINEEDRLISAGISPNDQSLDRATRPLTLQDYIGQSDVKRQMEIFIGAARDRKEAMDHVLISGPPGLGKTTLANIIANELQVSIKTTSGPVLEKAGDLAAMLTNLEAGDVLFIDEIHRLSPAIEEILYPAMEDYQLDIMIGEGPSARSIKLDLPPFTLVGATTRAGLLTSPLRDRFVIREHLDYYSPAELAEIVRRSAVKLAMPMDDATADEISHRSRGTPRLANNRLRWIRDFSTSRAEGRMNVEIARTALEMQGIDELGLDGFDRRYLETMSSAADTLEDDVEPFLLRCELVVRTPRGRRLTARGEEHLGAPPQAAPQGKLF